MTFEWPNRDPSALPSQIEGIPPYYGEDVLGNMGELFDGDIINLNSKLYKFEMSDAGYIGSRYRVHNDRDDDNYSKNVVLSATKPVIVDVEDSTQTQDTYHTTFEVNDLPLA